MPTNHAAFLAEKQAPQLEVRQAPYEEPKENEILIKTTALAINPVDWKIQDYGMFLEKYPNILGEDVAGKVVAVGPGVSGFKVGDRAFGHCMSLGNGNQRMAGFQEYVILSAPLMAKTPDNISDEEAAVLPLGVNTACSGLFEEVGLGMTMPPSAAGKGKAVLIWGGSSSVGACALQLASHAGYEVYTTSSKRNHDFCKSLGATEAFDYNSPSLVDDVVAALKGKTVVGGMDTISEEKTIKAACEIIEKSGATKKLCTTLPGSEQHATSGVEIHAVFAMTVAGNEVGPHIWNFLPKALSDGSFKAKPDRISAGKGLESVQKGLQMNKEGVSAKKVVVSL